MGGLEDRIDQAGVTLIDAGELDNGLDRDRFWMAGTCGAVINRCTDDD